MLARSTHRFLLLSRIAMASSVAHASWTTCPLGAGLSSSVHINDLPPAVASTSAWQRAPRLALKSGTKFSSPLARFLEQQSQIQGRRKGFASVVCAVDRPRSEGNIGLTAPTKPVLPEITFHPSDIAPAAFQGSLLLYGVFEDDLDLESAAIFEKSLPLLHSADLAEDHLLSEMIAEEEFKGKKGQSVVAKVQGKGYKRVGVVGLGKKGEALASTWQALGGVVASAAKKAKATTAGVVVLGGEGLLESEKVTAIRGITTGTYLGTFDDSRFKKEAPVPLLQSVAILGLPCSQAEEEIGRAMRLASGIVLARQLVNAPSNVLTPAAMAEVAEGIASAHSDVMTAKIMEADECQALGMGAFLAVAAASANAPKFIHLKYSPPGGKVNKTLAIVGKGLTFDSGGYNIKVAGGMMELMKFDMGGAAAVLGAAKAIGAIQPEGVEVHFIVASCENMISGDCMRPGDVLTAYNGKTIEVGNTDAEGRLTLADALGYACSQKIDWVVDLATLTGANIIALGQEIAGLYSNSDSLSEEITVASKAAGEKLWRMPMEKSYFDNHKSTIADMNNMGLRYGGAISASLFLQEFVDEGVPFAHIDMAGPVWDWKANTATGWGVATLVSLVQANASAEIENGAAQQSEPSTVSASA
eukprot:TRINITY_DN2804_c0_g1_i1.p1 TRINITY_DN2804_c0_g1~~TRINITY_DN2804_c0_g1_i1.p1  ORF type:complete len:643 (+),score=147.35 TRINITY_DN2804_c0_g1_i1:26-1954(+)